MLYLIGLGLGDERDVTVRGLEIIRSCDDVWLESYTAVLPGVNVEKLEAFYQRPVKIADRDRVESGADAILEAARTKQVALLVVGDVFSATTHTDIWMRCKNMGIEISALHNASILTAVGCVGLSLYRFGQTVSLPLFQGTWRPDSFYDRIKSNQRDGLHTLCLLDIKVKEPNYEMMMKKGKIVFDPPYFMTVREAIEQLLEVEDNRKEGVVSREKTICVGVARLGLDSRVIASGTLQEVAAVDFGEPLHSLVLCGELHPMEKEMIDCFKASSLPPASST